VIEATWLDQQLIGGGPGLGDLGFGGEAKQAMQQRADFLREQGLAQRRGPGVTVIRHQIQHRVVAAAEGGGVVDRAQQLQHEIPGQRAWRQLVPIGARRIDEVEALAQFSSVMAEPKKGA